MIPNQALTRVPIPTYSEADPGQAPQMYLLCESKRAQWGLRAMLAITVPKIAVFTQPQAIAVICVAIFGSDSTAAIGQKQARCNAGNRVGLQITYPLRSNVSGALAIKFFPGFRGLPDVQAACRVPRNFQYPNLEFHRRNTETQ